MTSQAESGSFNPDRERQAREVSEYFMPGHGGHTFLLERLNNKTEIDEAVSEAIEAILSNPKFGTFEKLPQVCSVIASGIAYQLNKEAEQSENVPLEDKDFSDEGRFADNLHAALNKAEVGAQVREILDELSPLDKEILVLHYIDGATLADLSKRYSLSDDRIKTKVVNARSHFIKSYRRKYLPRATYPGRANIELKGRDQ